MYSPFEIFITINECNEMHFAMVLQDCGIYSETTVTNQSLFGII